MRQLIGGILLLAFGLSGVVYRFTRKKEARLDPVLWV